MGEREDGRRQMEGRSVWYLDGQRDVKELGKGLKMETGELVGGFICAEGMPGAALVVVFTGLLVGSIVCEDWKVKQTCMKRTK